jgi:hypothetical protein
MADKERYLDAAATFSQTFKRSPAGRESWAIHTILDGENQLDVLKAHRILAGVEPQPNGIVVTG